MKSQSNTHLIGERLNIGHAGIVGRISPEQVTQQPLHLWLRPDAHHSRTMSHHTPPPHHIPHRRITSEGKEGAHVCMHAGDQAYGTRPRAWSELGGRKGWMDNTGKFRCESRCHFCQPHFRKINRAFLHVRDGIAGGGGRE